MLTALPRALATVTLTYLTAKAWLAESVSEGAVAPATGVKLCPFKEVLQAITSAGYAVAKVTARLTGDPDVKLVVAARPEVITGACAITGELTDIEPSPAITHGFNGGHETA